MDRESFQPAFDKGPEGFVVVEPTIFYDARGSFQKLFPFPEDLPEAAMNIKQVNFSHNNNKGTLRGMHFQVYPKLEWKIVRCVQGSLFDVLVDLRQESSTYLQHFTYFLDKSSLGLVVPPLVAHGFQTLEDNTAMVYLHSSEYSEAHSSGVSALDPDLNINWPLPISEISKKDSSLPRIKNLWI